MAAATAGPRRGVGEDGRARGWRRPRQSPTRSHDSAPRATELFPPWDELAGRPAARRSRAARRALRRLPGRPEGDRPTASPPTRGSPRPRISPARCRRSCRSRTAARCCSAPATRAAPPRCTRTPGDDAPLPHRPAAGQGAVHDHRPGRPRRELRRVHAPGRPRREARRAPASGPSRRTSSSGSPT